MKLHLKIFGLTINALKYIAKDDKFVTKCYLDCDDAVKEMNIERKEGGEKLTNQLTGWMTEPLSSSQPILVVKH